MDGVSAIVWVEDCVMWDSEDRSSTWVEAICCGKGCCGFKRVERLVLEGGI